MIKQQFTAKPAKMLYKHKNVSIFLIAFLAVLALLPGFWPAPANAA